MYYNLYDAVKNIEDFSTEKAMCAGIFSAIYKIDKKTVLIKTVEKRKIEFLEILFQKNFIYFEVLKSEHEFIYEAKTVLLHDEYFIGEEDECDEYEDRINDISKALAYVSDYYGSDIFSNKNLNPDTMPEDIFARWFDENQIEMNYLADEFYEAIEESFFIIKKMDNHDIRVDLHLDQFMREPSEDNSGNLLLIDAVITDEHQI